MPSALRPDIGAVVTLGKVTGRVVRQLEEGFAIEFTRLQHRTRSKKASLPISRVNAVLPSGEPRRIKTPRLWL